MSVQGQLKRPRPSTRVHTNTNMTKQGELDGSTNAVGHVIPQSLLELLVIRRSDTGHYSWKQYVPEVGEQHWEPAQVRPKEVRLEDLVL